MTASQSLVLRNGLNFIWSLTILYSINVCLYPIIHIIIFCITIKDYTEPFVRTIFDYQ